MQEKNKALERNTVILSFGILFSKVLSLFVIPFFSRWLGTEEYGRFDLCNTIIALIVPIVSFSCGEALFRLLIEASDRQREDSIITSCTNIYLLGYMVGAIISLPICYFFLKIELYFPFVFFLTGDMIYNFGTALARGKKNMVVFSFASCIYMIILAVVSIFCVKIMMWGIKGLLLSYGFAFMSAGLITLYKCDFHYKIKETSHIVVKELLQYSIPTLPNTVSWWVMQVSDRSIIAATLGNTYNGIYAVANYLPAMCTTMFNAFHWSWQQDISEKINDDSISEYINKVFNKVLEIILSLSYLIVAITFLIFRFVFSNDYMLAYYQVGILVCSTVVLFEAQFLGSIMVGYKDTRALGETTVIAATVNIGIDIFLIDKIGLYAASLSTLFGNVILLIVRLWIIHKNINIKLEAKLYIEWGIFFLVFFLYYLNDSYLNAINLIMSIGLFVGINHKILIELFKKVKKCEKRWRK